MIINDKLICDIFDLKIKIKGKDKEKLSKYQELIPMYDIYSKQIYPIKKLNLHYRLIECDYRFINNEVLKWITQLYEKAKKRNNNVDMEKFKKNLEIMENYDIDVLIETSYKTLYQYSPKLGLLISICKRNSFHPFIHHLKPYYTKLELIKLGQNMKLIKNLEIDKLLDEELHYSICKKISLNDVSWEEIKNHTLHIIDSKTISYFTFYSFYGSFLYNRLLRENEPFNKFFYDGLNKITKTINSSPKLENDYYVYRFIWDDSFINNLSVGDEFIDYGFLSTTRDPFYNPGLNGKFGLTLIKIYINKDKTNDGLLIENFSLFPKEEEYLLSAYSSLKLINKDDNFKYYHTNETFEKLITKKYEFVYLGNKFKLDNIKIKNNFKIIDNFREYTIEANTRIELFKRFMGESDNIIIKLNNKEYNLFCMFFDSTEQSSYTKFYYNKINNGLLISIYEEGYPYLNIECGNELVVNYINQFYFYNETKKELNEELLDIVLEVSRIFYYKEAKIFYNYRNFSEFSIENENKIFYYTNFYNHTLYDYIKNNKKFLNFNFIKNKISWHKLNQILDNEVSNELKNKYKFDKKLKTLKDYLIYIIEENFILYEKFMDDIDNLLLNFKNNNYFIFETYDKLNNQNRLNVFNLGIEYEKEDNIDNNYKLIFRQPIRRY